jgi:hypothetical protein
MTVPAGSVTSLLPNRLDELCGAESESPAVFEGFVEQPSETAISNKIADN